MGLPRSLWGSSGPNGVFFALSEVAVYLSLDDPQKMGSQDRLSVAAGLLGFVLVSLTGFWLFAWVTIRLVMKLNRVLEARSIARADVSLGWQRQAGRRLEVNLTELSLNGTRLGGDIQGLSFLGPAEVNEGAPEGTLEYPSRGLYLEMHKGRLLGFHVELAPASEDDPRPVIFCGRDGSKQLDRSSTEADITAALGEPYWRDESNGRVALIFERRNGKRWVELRLELDKAGRLDYCAVLNEPELEDRYWRERMQVTKAWPPERETGLG